VEGFWETGSQKRECPNGVEMSQVKDAQPSKGKGCSQVSCPNSARREA
jgi:hypothetical protein